jgi:hypothetical protein
MNSFRSEIGGLLALGILLAGVGVWIMFGNWPETSVYGSAFLDEPVVTESGSAGGVVFGALIATTGQIMTTVAIIAIGVRLGTQGRAVTPAP